MDGLTHPRDLSAWHRWQDRSQPFGRRAHRMLGVLRDIARPDGHAGNAVLTRLAVRGSRIFDLSQPDREPRGGIRLDLELPHGADRPLHLFNVHFGLKIRERASQVRMLVREHILHDELTGPRVVVGDLNEWFWFPGAVGRTLRRELHGPRIRRTHPAPLPLFPLDRIYWDRGLDADGFRVHRSRLARVASDHLPVVARLRLAPA